MREVHGKHRLAKGTVVTASSARASRKATEHSKAYGAWFGFETDVGRCDLIQWIPILQCTQRCGPESADARRT